MKVASVLAGILGGVIGQLLGATLVLVNAIRFGDTHPIPAGSALFLFSWVGFLAALTALRRPRASFLIHLGAIVGLIAVALGAHIWSLSVPVALFALSGGYTLRAARGDGSLAAA